MWLKRADGSSLRVNKDLRNSHLSMEARLELYNGTKMSLREPFLHKFEHPMYGKDVWKIVFDLRHLLPKAKSDPARMLQEVQEKIREVRVSAVIKDPLGRRTQKDVILVARGNVSEPHLHISTSTLFPQVSRNLSVCFQRVKCFEESRNMELILMGFLGIPTGEI